MIPIREVLLLNSRSGQIFHSPHRPRISMPGGSLDRFANRARDLDLRTTDRSRGQLQHQSGDDNSHDDRAFRSHGCRRAHIRRIFPIQLAPRSWPGRRRFSTGAPRLSGRSPAAGQAIFLQFSMSSALPSRRRARPMAMFLSPRTASKWTTMGRGSIFRARWQGLPRDLRRACRLHRASPLLALFAGLTLIGAYQLRTRLRDQVDR